MFAAAFGPWPSTAQDIIYARHSEPNSDYVFETEDLERMLLETSERIRLEDLFVRMLRLVTRNRFINSSNWQTYYSKEFDKREYDQLNPFIQQQEDDAIDQQSSLTIDAQVEVKNPELLNYFTFDLDTRVYLLHLLCEWQLDEPERFREHLDSEEDAVQWRVDPIGFDRKGSTFWLFDDNRLYKETPKPAPVKKLNARNKKKKKGAVGPSPPARSSRRSTRSSAVQEEQESVEEKEEEQSEDEREWVPWKLLCYTKHDWENLPSKYANSKNIDEQRFHKLLVDDLLPKVLPVLEEHEQKIKKQEAIMHRKRSSRIRIKELEALERASVEPVLEAPVGSGGRNRSNRIEQKVLEKQQQEKEASAKAREERLLERERRILEREYRALKSQTDEETVPEIPPEAENNGPIIIDGTSPLPKTKTTKKTTKKSPKTAAKASVKAAAATGEGEGNTEQKPKRKYVKKPKFDENGNPIPRKVKLDKDGNPIPLKKRGRKPKNKDEDSWQFDCVCGVSGANIVSIPSSIFISVYANVQFKDDGTPLIACEKCGTWQHIVCLERSGQLSKTESMDNLKFVCRKCEKHQEEEERERKRQRDQYYNATTVSSSVPTAGSTPQTQSFQSPWQQHRASPVSPNHTIPQQQIYQPPNTSVLPPIRSFPLNQTSLAQHQETLPVYDHQTQQRQQQRLLAPQYFPPQQLQQQHSGYPPNASHQQHQPLLNASQTYPQATVSQQQTIQSIVSQVASNPHSLAQLASFLDKNLQQKRQ
ncbi:hypothetical protein [Parasitella parasitica]|uniref:Zinc finger PHD-type domain-containing protein n=1 Tax=Parasitella parasitica TaxID=35722 RepID=A0A0B7NSS7_9FUNG|nr:hypothetical protein [Parasitella parasitica]